MNIALKVLLGVLVAALVYLAVFYSHDRLTRDSSILEVKNYDGFESAYFAGGCFWCVEADFEKLSGVEEAISGYMGGEMKNPTYKDHGDHREAVRVIYDSDIVDYETLVQYFFRHHDPTDEGGSFYDRGFQYTSAIYPNNEGEEETALRIIDEIDEEGVFESEIVTAVESGKKFWRAEEYHQDYYINNPTRYNGYRFASGRDKFIKDVWGDRLNEYGSTASKWSSYKKPSDSVLKDELTELEFRVTQLDKTEKPFSEGNLDDNKEDGIYVDILSGEPLYSSKDKYDSGTGWPSFTRPISNEFVVTKPDYKLIIPRTEVRSKYGDNHLGHVFKDGPEPTGERWCMNGAALEFVPLAEMESRGYGDYVRFVE